MSRPRKQLELADEQASEKRFRAKIDEDARRPIRFAGPANSAWTGSGLPKKSVAAVGEFVGRVALMSPKDELPAKRGDFYIGDAHAEFEDFEVFSWTAPIAATFYRGKPGHEWSSEVAVTRTFIHQGGKIADFADDVVRRDAPPEPFAARRLAVPDAPTRRKLPSAARHVQGQPRSYEVESRTATERQSSGPGFADIEGAPPIRAESALLAQLQAPRTRALRSVLATLQTDQYELVTVPASKSMIIEGQPGTGKTIVASHRAAYLINASTPQANAVRGNVLLVGPTTGYSQHVKGVTERLAGGSARIKVRSMLEIMSDIVGLDKPPQGRVATIDVDRKLGILASEAISRLRGERGIDAFRIEDAYDLLRSNGSELKPLTRDRMWVGYLGNLPRFKHALKLTAHTALLAYMQWELDDPDADELSPVGHVIVDEAQDVTELEWLLLERINRGQSWTILGDFNQRRSDVTVASWEQVTTIIAAAKRIPVRRLARGYRSTKPILEFANQLLPKGQRALKAFQQFGPDPVIVPAESKERAQAAVREVDRLLEAYSEGTVAVISVDPAAVTSGFRRGGWQRSDSKSLRWERNGRTVVVTDPDEARGLEFDGVVVVEPADFIAERGRVGLLYTSLTRPNRELVVVHTKPLPSALKRR